MRNMHFDTIDSFLNYDFNRKNGAPTYQICFKKYSWGQNNPPRLDRNKASLGISINAV